MEKLIFKTTIKCSGCVEKVTPYLNELAGNHWHVDLQHPDKLLTVENTGNTSAATVIEALGKAGYTADIKQ